MTKVVCIQAPTPRFARVMRQWRVTPPKVGETYTVRGTYNGETASGKPRVYLLLAEIRSRRVRYASGWAEAGFPKHWFREVKDDETSQDISMWISGADPASEVHDNRRKQREKVI